MYDKSASESRLGNITFFTVGNTVADLIEKCCQEHNENCYAI